MEYFVYLCYRAFTALVACLPMGLVYRLGALLGRAGYFLFGNYRRLAARNLTIAFGGERTAREIRRLARAHFARLGGNLLCGVKASTLDEAGLRRIVEVENAGVIGDAVARGKGVVLVIGHQANWELLTQLTRFLPFRKRSTIYQPLGNRHIEEQVQRMRRAGGIELFSRKNGFGAPTAFLREGGAVGVLVDQHAGDGGVWTPFFGRLASTSTLAALLALRTGAEIVPISVRTVGAGRWRGTVHPPIPQGTARAGGETEINTLTARINEALEAQIRASPEDWFWVHNRWKTPKPKFLLATYRRGVTLRAGMTTAANDLKPFRILLRSPNWLGDAVMAIPAVQAIARGRPDAQVTVLAPARLADLWRVAPGVAAVIPIERGQGVYAVGAAVKRVGPFDVAVLLPNSLRAALEAWLAGVPRRVGFLGHRRKWLLNQIVAEPKKISPATGERLHLSRRYAHLAREIGAAEVAARGEAPSDANIPKAAAERGGFIRLALCPGAEYGPTKRWLPERFAEAAKRVAGQHPVEWVLVGTEKDRPLGEVIEREIGGQCENLLGKTTLAELMAILRGCRALLTNDTGTMHLAAWLGVPTVAIFGSTDPVATGPLAAPEAVRILRHQVECSPCFLRECPLDLRCMKAVSAEEAAEAVEEILAGSANSSKIGPR